MQVRTQYLQLLQCDKKIKQRKPDQFYQKTNLQTKRKIQKKSHLQSSILLEKVQDR